MGSMNGIKSSDFFDPLNMAGMSDVSGGVLGSGARNLFGKPDPKYSEEATKAATEAQKFLTQMGSEYWGATSPVRSSVINRATDFMQGNLDPTASAMYAPSKMVAERQYGTARKQIMSQLPSGGGLQGSLADLQSAKAGTITDLVGKIVQDEYNKAYALSMGSPAASATALGSGLQGGSALVNALANQQNAGVKAGQSGMDWLGNIMSLFYGKK